MENLQIDPSLVYLDPYKLSGLLVNEGLSDKEFAGKLYPDLSLNTVMKAVRGKGVSRSTAKLIADFFGEAVLSLVGPLDPLYKPSEEVSRGVAWEWQFDAFLQPGGCRTSNGLHFFLCRMKHRHTAGRFGRGKFYVLTGLSAEERERKHEHLKRHADVCLKLGRHPQLAENESSTPTLDNEYWWVVDRWVAEKSLADYLGPATPSDGRESKPWPAADLPRLMKGIAEGLSVLHGAAVIMRELAPARVLIGDSDGQPVLTDFELAKMLTGVPTVSPLEPWPDDPYRAPEIERGEVSFASDLYSWGRILVHAACGHLPPADGGKDVDALTRVGLPKAVWSIARDCLAERPQDRPQSAAVVQQTIRRWQ